MRSAERWLPLGLVALLVALGALQYRWTGALGEAEKERMEAGLRSSLRRFSVEVEDELARVFRFFLVESEEDLKETYRTWAARENEEGGSVVEAVYLRRGSETLELTPESFELAPSSRAFDFDPREHPLGRSPLAMWVPMSEPRERRMRRPEPPETFVVVTLDPRYLTESLLPEARLRHLGEYDVVVSDGTDAFWSSDGADVAGTLQEPDGVGGLFEGPFRGFRQRPRPGPDSAFGPGPPRPRGRARRGDAAAFREGARPPEGAFRVFVRHQAGSLQAAVDQARFRNLGLGFAVLLVLAASIALLSESARRARRLSEQQMEFVAGVSHELRTPVAVIRSAAQNLGDGSVSEPSKVERYGELIEGEARRLEQLVEEVLELAGIQSNKRQYRREPIEARELLDAVLDAARGDLEGREIVTRLADGAEGLMVVGDREALTRALSNLLRNAIKHGGDGAIELVLSRRGESVVFAVSDRGSGIDEADRPHLFEAFYRGRRARERQIPGSGLGLSLVSHIVHEHGGEVSALEREGGGTTFEIRLPGAGGESLS